MSSELRVHKKNLKISQDQLNHASTVPIIKTTQNKNNKNHCKRDVKQWF